MMMMMIIITTNKQNINNLQLSFTKIGGFSLNVWNGYMETFLSVYFLF
jgi:hypothetical protein